MPYSSKAVFVLASLLIPACANRAPAPEPVHSGNYSFTAKLGRDTLTGYVRFSPESVTLVSTSNAACAPATAARVEGKAAEFSCRNFGGQKEAGELVLWQAVLLVIDADVRRSRWTGQ